jgi:hypothetical protein
MNRIVKSSIYCRTDVRWLSFKHFHRASLEITTMSPFGEAALSYGVNIRGSSNSQMVKRNYQVLIALLWFSVYGICPCF